MRLGVLFGFLCFSLVCCTLGEKLKLLIVLHRHGQRSPIHLYNNDPNTAKMWPEGLGQLTKQGKIEEHRLGLFLRQRYDHFLSKNYNEKYAYFRSSDTRRTLMSAQLVAAGLYPATGAAVWTNKTGLTAWQPIPVSSVPYTSDSLLKGNKVFCPRASLELQKSLDSGAIGKFSKKYNWLFQKLTNHTRQEVNALNFTHVLDAVFNEMLHSMPQPAWVESLLKPLRECRNEFATLLTPTLKLKRLFGGELVKTILGHCSDKIKEQNEKQLIDYSAHDKTISILMSTLGIHNGIQPPYSSAIIFELFSKSPKNDSSTRKHWLRIVYRNDTSAEPYELVLPGCNGTTCSLDQFIVLTKDKIVENREEECQVPK